MSAIAGKKYCDECKNCIINAKDPRFSRCSLAPDKNNIYALVSAKCDAAEDYTYCTAARCPGNPCGPHGLLFEPAPIPEVA